MFCFVPLKPVVRIPLDLSPSADVLVRHVYLLRLLPASVHKAKHHFRALKQSARVNTGQRLDSARLKSQNNNYKKSFINTIIIEGIFSH